jgi:DNA-binding MarR family transcriptional regulator
VGTRLSRSYVRWDRFAWSQIGREHGLSASELVVLEALTWFADFRSASWTGTTTDLAAELRLSRNTVAAAFDRLADCGLIVEEAPFGGHRSGRVRVVVYDQLVVESRKSARNPDPESAPQPRTNRPLTATQTRRDARITSENEDAVGIAVEGDGGVAMCEECGKPCVGHPFDHDPVYPEGVSSEILW